MAANCGPIGHFTVVSEQASWGVEEYDRQDVYMCRECRIRADFDHATINIRTNVKFGCTDHTTCDVCKMEGLDIP